MAIKPKKIISSRGEIGVGGSARGAGIGNSSSAARKAATKAKVKETKTAVKTAAKKTPLTTPTSGVKVIKPGSMTPPKIVQPPKPSEYKPTGGSVKVIKPGSKTLSNRNIQSIRAAESKRIADAQKRLAKIRSEMQN